MLQIQLLVQSEGKLVNLLTTLLHIYCVKKPIKFCWDNFPLS